MDASLRRATLRRDRIILAPGAVISRKDISHDLIDYRWRYVAGPESGVQIVTKRDSQGEPKEITIGKKIDFGDKSTSVHVIGNSGNEEALLLRCPTKTVSDVLGGIIMSVVGHLGLVATAIMVGAVWLLGGAIALLVLFFIGKVLWETGAFLMSTVTYDKILKDPGATATLLGVLIAGLFGFAGIILTNVLTARSARQQSADNERKARELQETIALGMDRRIRDFAEAFERYHSETLKALKRD